MTTKAEIIQAVYDALPYSDQVVRLDIDGEESAIRFRWRGTNFRVSLTGHTEEALNGCLHGTDLALLARTLIQQSLARIALAKTA